MPPTKSQSTLLASKGVTKSIVSLSRRAIPTRTQHQKVLIDNSQNAPVGKRKADASPGRNVKDVKRSALGNVTNAVLNAIEDSKKLTRTKADVKKTTLTKQPNGKTNENQVLFAAPNAIQRAHKIVTRASSRATESTRNIVNEATVGLKKVNISTTIVKGKKKTETTANNNNTKVECHMPTDLGLDNELKPNVRRLSNEFELDNEESHYMSALEDL